MKVWQSSAFSILSLLTKSLTVNSIDCFKNMRIIFTFETQVRNNYIYNQTRVLWYKC